MKLKFLGTNGWFPSGTGSTPCVSIRMQDRLIVFDAGGGFAKVKEECEFADAKRIDVFISHLHLDHIEGLHTLARLPEEIVARIFAPRQYLKPLGLLLGHPYTAPLGMLKANARLLPFEGAPKDAPYLISSLPLKHADPCFGYRLEAEGRTIAYCTDTGPCGNLLKLARNADLFITECSLLPGSEISKRWPHLNPETAASLAKKAGAKKLALTHFDASNYSSSALRNKALASARRMFKNTIAAKDGLVVEI
ncbi:MAG: ribonuclease Z [Candidatus Anstonellaceae archaeon]